MDKQNTTLLKRLCNTFSQWHFPRILRWGKYVKENSKAILVWILGFIAFVAIAYALYLTFGRDQSENDGIWMRGALAQSHFNGVPTANVNKQNQSESKNGTTPASKSGDNTTKDNEANSTSSQHVPTANTDEGVNIAYWLIGAILLFSFMLHKRKWWEFTLFPYTSIFRKLMLSKKQWRYAKERADSILVVFLGFIAFFLVIGALVVFAKDYKEIFLGKPITGDGTGLLNIIGWILSGIIAALGVIFLNKRARAMDNQANAQYRSADAQYKSVDVQVKNNEQAQFGQGIQHLGHDSESVRLGGVHTLYQLAEGKSTKDRYRKTVHSILYAHLRSRTASKEYRDNHKEKPSEEIQNLLDILTKEAGSIFREYELKADFQSAFLCGADLRKAHLEEVILAETHLERAVLFDAHLEGADLREANLGGAFLARAYLEGADLRKTHLEDAGLQNAHLEDAGLQNAHLEDADLQGAYLDGVDFFDACLEGANLRRAYLEGADLLGVHLEGADLRYAHLEAMSVHEAHLHGARLDGACLHGVCSTRSNAVMDSFQDSIMSRVGKDTELDNAIFEGGVKEEQIERCENVKWHTPEKKEAMMDILKSNTGEEKQGRSIENLKNRYLSKDRTGKLTQKKADEIIQRYEQKCVM